MSNGIVNVNTPSARLFGAAWLPETGEPVYGRGSADGTHISAIASFMRTSAASSPDA